jgi:hypothetical protein
MSELAAGLVAALAAMTCAAASCIAELAPATTSTMKAGKHLFFI